MNTARLIAWLVLPIVGLVVVGALAIAVLHAVLHLVGYLIVGVLVVGGGLYIYSRARRAIGPGTRNRRRIEAATRTYRMRKDGQL
jgi:tellurite resistance protein TehA-like permease